MKTVSTSIVLLIGMEVVSKSFFCTSAVHVLRKEASLGLGAGAHASNGLVVTPCYEDACLSRCWFRHRLGGKFLDRSRLK